MIKLPPGVDIQNLIGDLRVWSWEAADILIYYSRLIKDSRGNIDLLKNVNLDDPVTLADLKVNDFIIGKFNEKYKNVDWGILSEENVKSGIQDYPNKCNWLWVLDPLDGTKDFIQGTANYAMHLGLNYKQKPLLGIVLIPEKNELWISIVDHVWCENKSGIKKLSNLSKNRTLKEMTLVTSKNNRNGALADLTEKIGFKKVVIMGSIGCKIASILRGEGDIYICLSMPGGSCPKDWDFSAPEAILKAAGGAITNIDNEDLNYGNSNFKQDGIIVATNNRIDHKSICSEIKATLRKYDLYAFN